MTDTTPTTEYRARPLPEVSIPELLKVLQPNQRVVVTAKNILKSATIVINGALFAAAATVQIIDIVTGANIIGPIVGVFTKDPQVATNVITVVTQVYSVLNILLRFKTTQPVTLRTDAKE